MEEETKRAIFRRRVCVHLITTGAVKKPDFRPSFSSDLIGGVCVYTFQREESVLTLIRSTDTLIVRVGVYGV